MIKLSPPVDLIKKSVNIFAKKENLLFLVKIYTPVAIFSIIYIAQSYLPDSIVSSNSVWLVIGAGVVQILNLLTSIFVTVSGIIALGEVVGGGKLSVGKIYKKAWKNYWTLLLLSITLAVIYLFGFIFLIVPGMLFVVWFAFSRFMAVEKGFGVREALIRSKELVKGVYWKILGRLIVFGVFAVIVQMVLSVIPYGVGSVVGSLFGGLYMLPLFLLYKELDAS